MATYEIFIEENPRVKEWLKDRPEGTRELYAIALKKFCETMKITPNEWQNLDRFKARDLAWNFVSEFKGEQSTKALTYLAALKSFYRNKDGETLPFDGKRGGKHYLQKRRKKVDKELIPDKTQVYRVTDASMSLRDHTMFLVAFQSGIRLNALCALNYGHVHDQLYPEPKVPLILKITENMDTKLRAYNLTYYYTFLQGEAAQCLRAYCDKYHKKSTDETPLFKTKSEQRMDRRTVWRVFKRAVARAGMNPESLWVHSLRKAFKKVVNKAPISEDFREAIMGHVLPGSRENYFDRHDINELAEEYMKINFTRDILENNHAKLKTEMEQLQMQNLSLAGMVEELRKELATVKSDLKALKES